MRWRIFIAAAVVALSLILAPGCSTLTGTADKPGHEILRQNLLGTDWQMYQLRLTLPSGTDLQVLLRLNDGDKADGYFYLEKGSNIDFSIKANSQLYQTTKPASGKVSSDRFSFIASQAQGSIYSLTFNNPATAREQVVIFLDVICPAKGSIYVPLAVNPSQTP